jgi:hypothetical protein
MADRDRLIEKVTRLGPPPRTREDPEQYPVVSLEDFFEDNRDPGSIGCNLSESVNPGIDGFFEILKRIRDRSDVQDVLVEVHEVVEEDPTVWPFSDRIYIISSATREDVESWVSVLHPDEVAEGFVFGVPSGAPLLKSGMRVYGVWWD